MRYFIKKRCYYFQNAFIEGIMPPVSVMVRVQPFQNKIVTAFKILFTFLLA